MLAAVSENPPHSAASRHHRRLPLLHRPLTRPPHPHRHGDTSCCPSCPHHKNGFRLDPRGLQGGIACRRCRPLVDGRRGDTGPGLHRRLLLKRDRRVRRGRRGVTMVFLRVKRWRRRASRLFLWVSKALVVMSPLPEGGASRAPSGPPPARSRRRSPQPGSESAPWTQLTR